MKYRNSHRSLYKFEKKVNGFEFQVVISMQTTLVFFCQDHIKANKVGHRGPTQKTRAPEARKESINILINASFLASYCLLAWFHSRRHEDRSNSVIKICLISKFHFLMKFSWHWFFHILAKTWFFKSFIKIRIYVATLL